MGNSQAFSGGVFTIHRKLFCQVVDENREYFEMALNRKITGEQLLEEAKHQPLFSGLLQNNEALLGMILGFGKNNSQRYPQEKNAKKLGIFPRKADQAERVQLPVFRADWGDAETQELRERYLNCREKIKTTFLEHDAFDEVLKILFE